MRSGLAKLPQLIVALQEAEQEVHRAISPHGTPTHTHRHA